MVTCHNISQFITELWPLFKIRIFYQARTELLTLIAIKILCTLNILRNMNLESITYRLLLGYALCRGQGVGRWGISKLCLLPSFISFVADVI